MIFNGIDYEKNLDEILKFQDKILKGIKKKKKITKIY